MLWAQGDIQKEFCCCNCINAHVKTPACSSKTNDRCLNFTEFAVEGYL